MGIVSSNPRFITVVIDISNKCNLRCRMCYFSHDKYFKADPIFITPPVFEKLAEKLLPHAVTLTLSCGSEPLVSPYFIEILKIASRYKPPHFDFATNGILMSEKISDAMIDYGVTDVMLSIDASSKKTYEAIRRGADFGRLIANIKYLTRQKEIRKSFTPELRINATLMRSNIEEIVDLIELAAELKVTYLDFRHMVVYEGLEMESESLVHYKDLTNIWLDKAKKRAQELGLKILTIPHEYESRMPASVPAAPARNKISIKKYINILRHNPKYFFSTVYSRLFDMLKKKEDTGVLYCTLPFTYTLINSGGHVLPCPHCHGVSEYGTLSSEGSFDEIWFNEKFRLLRKNILTNSPPKMCRECSIFEMYNTNEKKAGKTRKV